MAINSKKPASDRNAIVLPRPVPENVEDAPEDEKRADSDSAFDDLEIEIEYDEVEAETDRNPPGRKH
jgi:hypothetical protein